MVSLCFFSFEKVLAIDKDSGVNAQIKYFISDQTHQQFFNINQDSGQIMGTQSLDREKQDYFQVSHFFFISFSMNF